MGVICFSQVIWTSQQETSSSASPNVGRVSIAQYMYDSDFDKTILEAIKDEKYTQQGWQKDLTSKQEVMYAQLQRLHQELADEKNLRRKQGMGEYQTLKKEMLRLSDNQEKLREKQKEQQDCETVCCCCVLIGSFLGVVGYALGYRL